MPQFPLPPQKLPHLPSPPTPSNPPSSADLGIASNYVHTLNVLKGELFFFNWNYCQLLVKLTTFSISCSVRDGTMVTDDEVGNWEFYKLQIHEERGKYCQLLSPPRPFVNLSLIYLYIHRCSSTTASAVVCEAFCPG